MSESQYFEKRAGLWEVGDIGLPDSACRKAKATCSALYRDFFMGQPSFSYSIIPQNSHYDWINFRGEGHQARNSVDLFPQVHFAQ